MTTELESTIETLSDIDQQEAALREQLQQLANKKEAAKKAEVERAKAQLHEDIPDARINLLGLLQKAENLSVDPEVEYTVTLGTYRKGRGSQWDRPGSRPTGFARPRDT